MFGFGFIMSLIFFSLGSVGFVPPDRPLSMKPVLCRASAKKKQKRFFAACALGHSLHVQLWVSQGCAFWGRLQAEKYILEHSTCHGSPPLQLGLGRQPPVWVWGGKGPRYPGQSAFIVFLLCTIQ